MNVTPSEEPWEREIGAILGGLPVVDPPAGFIDSAIDHRPLHAGRLLSGLLAISLLALLATVVTGAVGRTRVTPELDELASRHATVVQAGVLGGSQAEVDYRIETPVDMPDGFERTRNLAAEDIRQAFYARGEESVSIFVQEGRVRWDSLPHAGHTEIDGLRAWVDENRGITVVETSNNIVTIVGLSGTEVGEVLETVPRRGSTFLDRVQDTIESITRQLGYPAVG